MKKIVLILVMIIIVGCGVNSKDKDKLEVVVTFGVLEELVEVIGGDKVTVNNIVGGDAHHWEPSPKDVIALTSSDLVVIVGAGFESWFDSVAVNIPTTTLIVDSSKSVDLIVRDEIVDPHIWLDPMNVVLQMDAIVEGLIASDPKNETYYRENYNNYRARLEELDASYRSSIQDGVIVVAHESFGYLAKAYGLKQVAVEGLAPSSEPSSIRIVEIVNYIKENNLTHVFYDSDRKVMDTIAKEVPVEVLYLSSLEVMDRDYISMMNANLEALKEALK